MRIRLPFTHRPPIWWIAKREWYHVRTRPLSRTLFIAIPSVLVLALCPPAPFLATGLQLWAATSYGWQRGWSTIMISARKGGWWLLTMALVTLFSAWHLWPITHLLAAANALWHILPFSGELALFPLTVQTLVARSLLLLPLAPALALLLERIDPRTIDLAHNRVLIQADLDLKKAPPEPSHASGPAHSPRSKKKRARPTPKQAPQTASQTPPAPSEPESVEGSLADPASVTTPPVTSSVPSSPSAAHPDPIAQPSTTSTPSPKEEEQRDLFDWNDIKE